MSRRPKYLGFDLSTQQLKAIVINDKREICHNVSVDFDSRLPGFKTVGGVHRNEHDEVTAPVFMWVQALELCLQDLKDDNLDFGSIVCVSGCAQQHGSVWWHRGASEKLPNMKSSVSLSDNLIDAFSTTNCPTWMDSSTSEECKMINHNLGSQSQSIESLTGSRTHERFTGPQIAKMINKKRDVYEKTERITLISNFLATILTGSYMPFDVCDAAGTNMMNINTKQWAPAVLRSIVSCNDSNLISLRDKLGYRDKYSTVDNIVESDKVIGKISAYFQNRFGFSPNCHLTSFTGDTISSMVGLDVARDELVISLGTSDTACFWLSEPRNIMNGHISPCPIDPKAYFGMVGFKNGSKTRERIRDQYSGLSGKLQGDWSEFDRQLRDSQPGNLGNFGFYFDLREIHPPCIGDFCYDSNDQLMATGFETPGSNVRACVEGQFLRLRNHIGDDILKSISLVRVTGGASTNREILQVIANIFEKPVHTFDIPNSACLGAAYLALHAFNKINFQPSSIEKNYSGESVDGEDSKHSSETANGDKKPTSVMVLNPQEDVIRSKIYRSLAERCSKLEILLDLERA